MPFLCEAMATSASELLFSAEDGAQRSADTVLHKVPRRALGRAGLVKGYNHVCRAQGLRLRGEEESCRARALPSLRHEALAPRAPSPAALP